MGTSAPGTATAIGQESPRRGRRARSLPVAARAMTVLLLAVAATVGCGDDDGSGNSEAQPLPGGSVFQEGGFDELPRYPGADAASEPAVEDDVTTQSFTTVSATPERVLGYYADELARAGWTTVEEPRRLGAESTWRGAWRNDGRHLVVSATEFAGFDDPGETRTTQYSLSLGPA